MRIKSFSVLLAILLVTAFALPLTTIVVAKPLEPNPDTWWPSGTIWGSDLMIENSAKTDMPLYSAWWGAKTGSEYAAPWPSYPPGATSYVGIWILKGGARKGMVVESQVSTPQSYSYIVQAEADTPGDWGWLSWVLENATHEFVPPDFSAVLENVNAGININLRAMDNTHMPLPWSATLYVDNAVNIENFENTTPLIDNMGENVSFSFDVVNTGRENDNYTLSVNSGSWESSVSPSFLFLTPGQSGSATVNVTLGLGSQDINVEAAGAYAWDNSPALTAMGIVPVGVDVSISPSYNNGLPGQTLGYTVKVTNTGWAAENYKLIASGTAGWLASIDLDSLALEPGESGEAVLSVTVPPDVGGSSMIFYVWAISSVDPTVRSNATCRALALEIGEDGKLLIPWAQIIIIAALIAGAVFAVGYLTRRRGRGRRRRVFEEVRT